MAVSDDDVAPKSSGQMTAVLPMLPGHNPGEPRQDEPTVTVTNMPFAKRDPRSETGRKKGDSAQPLDFTKHSRVGRFELIREIARGGMGQVFLARDTKLGRKVAIKFMLRDDEGFVQRFLVEARATARCTHENIVTIFEVGEHERLPYMVLELLEGKPLSDVLAGKPSLRQIVELMVPVVRALERAHEHGIVHRDLKPSNIFVTDRGQVKVLDFGIARLVDPAESAIEKVEAVEAIALDGAVAVTGSNSFVGTRPYMSPEQWGAAVVDHLSDIWAVGIMFWRALVGVHPTGTMAPDTLREQLRDLATPLPSIATRDPTIPPAIVAIVDRCLVKPKALRYQSATALLSDLNAFLAPKADRDSGEVCPYRGLSAFTEDDAKYFFGRSNEIRTALAQLESWPLLAVIGPSGVGKSSFVHAGLVPAMRAAGGTWHVHVLRPGRVPLHQLANVLEEALATGEQATDLIGQLRDAPGLFGATLRIAAARRQHNILVVVDQLEELFTLCDSDEIRRLFLDALLAAADDRSSPVRVVLSMRADFLDRLASHKHFFFELTRGLIFLTAPDQDNLRETLVRPAELAGHAFEDPWIVEDMMQAATSRGALSLLSFAATRLWEARDRPRKLLTVSAYNQMGGVGGAFARHADRVAASVPPQRQILLRALLTRLVTPEGTRAVVDRRELLSLAEDQREVDGILDQLVRARLIHLHTDPDQVATVEIVHEMLISEWPTLRRWLEDSQAIRGFMHELREAARQWNTHDRPADMVWRGATARKVLERIELHGLELSAVEKAFVAAIEKQAARARRRKMIVIASVASALAIVLAGAAIAVVRIKLAETEAKAKASEAVNALGQAQAAKSELQGKLDIIEQEKAKSLEADRKRLAAEQDATAATKEGELTKEQLEIAFRELKAKVLEAQAAKAKALEAEVAAKQATKDAQAANAKTKALLDEKHKEVERLEKAMEGIYSDDLIKKKRGSGTK